MLGVSLSISAVAAADSEFSIALMNVESFDWTSHLDMNTRVEFRAVSTLVALNPTTAEEAKAKTRALMMVLASPEKLVKSTDGKKSFDSRKMTHDLALNSLFYLCSATSSFAAEAQIEVATALGVQSRNRLRFMNLVNSFAPISEMVRQSFLAFTMVMAEELSKTCDKELKPAVSP